MKLNMEIDLGEGKLLRELLSLYDEIKYDVDSIKERDPAAISTLEVLLLYPGLHATMVHKLSHRLHMSGHKFSARMLSQLMRSLTGIEIHPGAKLGRGVFIDHGSAVVIGETAEVGDDCTLYQGVTLGGTGKDVGKRHPTLGSNVMVGAGAKILGPFKVGDNSKIAANAVVLEEVPANSTAVGIPARIVKRKNTAQNASTAQHSERPCPQDLDQVHIPDPVSQELCRLTLRLEALEKKLEQRENGEESE